MATSAIDGPLTGAFAQSGSVAQRRSFKEVLQASVAGKAIAAYNRAHARRPYRTQIISAMIIFLCGDLLAQFVVGGGQKQGEGNEEEQEAGIRYDPWRTLRQVAIAMTSAIPTYKWYVCR